MKDKSLSQVGGTCSILLGISYLLIGIIYLRLPAAQRPGIDPAQFLQSFAQSPQPLTFYYWVFALGSLLAFAAVIAISEVVRPANEGWVRWTRAWLGRPQKAHRFEPGLLKRVDVILPK